MILTSGQSHALQLFCSGESSSPRRFWNWKINPDIGYRTAGRKNGKRVAKTASTGIAAQLIGGRTVHSLLQAYPGVKDEKIDYEKKARNLDDVDVLIIDEISMLGRFFIQYLYNCLNHAEHHVQLILSGDFFSCPPVKDEYAFLSPYWNLLNLVPVFLPSNPAKR